MNFLNHFGTTLRRLVLRNMRRKSFPAGIEHPLDFAEQHCDKQLRPNDARGKYDDLVKISAFLSRSDHTKWISIDNLSISGEQNKSHTRSHQPAKNKGPASHQEGSFGFQLCFADQLANLEFSYSHLVRSLTEKRDAFLDELLDDRTQFAAWVHANAARLRQIGMNEKLSDPKRCSALNLLIAKNLLSPAANASKGRHPSVSEALQNLTDQLAGAISRATSSSRWSIAPSPAPTVNKAFASIAKNALRWMAKTHQEADPDRETRSTLIGKLKYAILADEATLDKGVAQAKGAFSARIFRSVDDARILRQWIDTPIQPIDAQSNLVAYDTINQIRTSLVEVEAALRQFHDVLLQRFDERLYNLTPDLVAEAEVTLDIAITNELFDSVFQAWIDSMWKPPRQRWIDFRTMLANEREDGLLGRKLESIWERREARHNLALGAAIRSISPDGDTVLRSDVSLALLVESRKSELKS